MGRPALRRGDPRQRDRERLMQDPLFTEEANEEDLAMAGAPRPALARGNRGRVRALPSARRLPAPEEMVDAGPDRDAALRAARQARPRSASAPRREPARAAIR